MICDELPLAYNKVDTVYRALKLLSEKGLINYKKHGEKDCVSLTKKGKEWNSDSNPTYKNTKINNTKISNIKKTNKKDSFDPISVKPKNLSVEAWSKWVEYRKEKGKKLTETSWRKHIELLESQNNPEVIIDKSILSGWIGLFPEKHVGKKSTPTIQPKQSGMTPERQCNGQEKLETLLGSF